MMAQSAAKCLALRLSKNRSDRITAPHSHPHIMANRPAGQRQKDFCHTREILMRENLAGPTLREARKDGRAPVLPTDLPISMPIVVQTKVVKPIEQR
jgi:hypothetical protein